MPRWQCFECVRGWEVVELGSLPEGVLLATEKLFGEYDSGRRAVLEIKGSSAARLALEDEGVVACAIAEEYDLEEPPSWPLAPGSPRKAGRSGGGSCDGKKGGNRVHGER